MILEHNLAITEFEERIQTLNQATRKEKDIRVHCAMMSERARLMNAMADFTQKKNEELADFQKEQGRNAPGRAVDLAHDWWNDEEADPVQTLNSTFGSCVDEDEDRGRLVAPFDDRWSDDPV